MKRSLTLPHCARSTVTEAIRARKNVRRPPVMGQSARPGSGSEPPDLFGNDGWKIRVERTSNAYGFKDPATDSDLRLEPKPKV